MPDFFSIHILAVKLPDDNSHQCADGVAAIMASNAEPWAECLSVCISGWYGNDNTGDEAILMQFLQEMSSNSVKITVLGSNARRIYSMYGAQNVDALDHPRLIGRGALRNLVRGRTRALVRTIASADLLVIGGGSLLHDRSGLSSLIRILDELWIARLYGRKIAMYAIGVGPLRSPVARWLVAKSLCSCALIAVRDRGSKRILTEIGIPSDQVHVAADPALLLKPHPATAERIGLDPRLLIAAKTSAIGVYLVDDLAIELKQKAVLVANLAAALDVLHIRFGWQFVFVPMMSEQGDDDRLIARSVRGSMRQKQAAHLVEHTLSPPEMLWLAGQFRANLTMRLHALIFSLSVETPALAIAYDPKVANTMADFDLGDRVVPLDGLTAQRIVDAMAELEHTGERYREILRGKLPEQRAAAGQTFEMMRGLLHNGAVKAGSPADQSPVPEPGGAMRTNGRE